MNHTDVTTVARAEALLAEWGAVNADRDTRVLLAWRSRVSKSRISQLMGIARSTVDAVIARAGLPEDMPACTRIDEDLPQATRKGLA